jgi:2-keto-4-pentenoate hydratase/2-oxohepta-3-ene-1,7-dioic acid hydratase in catechol pathway
VKVARFAQGDADPRYGILDDDDMLVVLKGHPLLHGYEPTGERVAFDDVRLLAPVIPSKVVCVGMNYAEHRADMQFASDAPDRPLFFLKPSTSVVGPGDPIRIPPVTGRIVHEAELAIVISRVAKQIRAEDWRDYVFGFTIANDVSARDEMFADGQWARAKGFDTFCPIGPWIETDLDPLSGLEIQSYVDGEPRRHGNTADMIFDVPAILAAATDIWTLLPGDVVITGTPSGLGGFTAGQRVDVDIEGIGRLSNPALLRD